MFCFLFISHTKLYCVELEAANSKGNSRQLFIPDSQINDLKVPATSAMYPVGNWQKFDWSCTNCRQMEMILLPRWKELNKNIGSKSVHHFVPRLLVPSIRQQVAKKQVLMMSQQNCSKQEERPYLTECTECMWWSGKLASGQRNWCSPRSSHFLREVILDS